LEGCLSEQDVVNLNTIVESITDTSIKNTSNLELLHEEQFNLIFFIISKWPRANLYPVLDILRILILFQSFQNYIKKNEIKLIDVLLERLRDENTEDVVLFVALKFICNFISIIDMENLKSYHAPIYMILEICSRRNDNNVLKFLSNVMLNYSLISNYFKHAKDPWVKIIIRILERTVDEDSILKSVFALGTLIVKDVRLRESIIILKVEILNQLTKLLTHDNLIVKESCEDLIKLLPEGN